jgi:ribosome-associated translation inhibitor RaiA
LGIGKISIDFFLNDTHEDTTCLIEVVNLHVKSKHNDIGEWLNDKVNKKIEDTTKGDNDFLKFKLQPVIWGEYAELARVEKYFDDGNNVTHQNALMPYALWIKHINAANIHFFCLNFEHISNISKGTYCTFQKSYLL